MTTDPKIWETSLEKLGKILSERYSISVINRGADCYTDGTLIVLPSISQDADTDYMRAMQGFLDHEAAHIVFSDFSVIDKAEKESSRLKYLTNALEDIRVEKEWIKLYRGSKSNLDHCLTWSLENNDETEDPPIFVRICKGIILDVQLPPDHWYRKELESIRPILNDLKYLLDTVDSCVSSKDCYDLAKKILERLDLPEEEDELEAMEKLSLAEAIKQRAESYEISDINTRYRIFTTEGDVVQLIESHSNTKYNMWVNDLQSTTGSLRSTLRRVLLSKRKDRWQCGKQRGSLHARSLHKIMFGTGKDVFKRRVLSAGFNTRCSLYVDHSYSMNSGKIETASKAALIFGECLNDLGIPFEICGFSTEDTEQGEERFVNNQDQHQLYTRWGSLWLGIYKDFEDPWFVAKKRVVTMPDHVKYNTFDGESVRIAASRLQQYPEKRKILFVFSDGAPVPTIKHYHPVHRKYLKEVVNEVEKSVEVLAVGIMSDNVKKYYTNYVVVSDIKKLPEKTIGELGKLLRRV